MFIFVHINIVYVHKLGLCAHKLCLCNINIVYVIFVQTAFHMGGLSRNCRKIAKTGSFSARTHYKSGYDSKFW